MLKSTCFIEKLLFFVKLHHIFFEFQWPPLPLASPSSCICLTLMPEDDISDKRARVRRIHKQFYKHQQQQQRRNSTIFLTLKQQLSYFSIGVKISSITVEIHIVLWGDINLTCTILESIMLLLEVSQLTNFCSNRTKNVPIVWLIFTLKNESFFNIPNNPSQMYI